MKNKIKWTRVVFTTGVVALLIGIFNPLGWSVVVATGAFLVTLSALAENDRHRYLYLASTFLVISGVILMYFVSSLGNYEIQGEWWWNLMIIPYPVGWIVIMATLLIKLIQKYGKQ